jgi:hypothetical protein
MREPRPADLVLHPHEDSARTDGLIPTWRGVRVAERNLSIAARQRSPMRTRPAVYFGILCRLFGNAQEGERRYAITGLGPKLLPRGVRRDPVQSQFGHRARALLDQGQNSPLLE